MVDVLLQGFYRIAQLGQTRFEPLRGAPRTFGLGFQLMRYVFFDDLIGDLRRLLRVGGGKSDVDEPRVFLRLHG